MSYQVCFTAEFKKMLKELQRCGGRAQLAAAKAQQALSEAQIEGEITCVPRTFHGEDRLPNVEKYHLLDSYRLVVQLIDGVNKVRAFLFVGDHEDSEAWLDSKRGYRYVRNEKDSLVMPVLITERETIGTRGFDLKSSDEYMQTPLLNVLNQSEIDALIKDSIQKEYVCKITPEEWENSSSNILDEIVDKIFVDQEKLADTVLNLLEIAHDNAPDKLQQMRLVIAKHHNEAKIVCNEELAKSLRESINAETFIEYDTDIGDFWNNHPNADWDDWMLFLSPKQKEWSKKELNGPARLCGVSGSGKTCVMLHRAVFLAKKYPREYIAILTLTQSMKQLLDSLLGRLCGAERAFIETFTVEGFLKNSILEKVHPRGFAWITRTVRMEDKCCQDLVEAAKKTIFNSLEFQRAPWQSFSEKEKDRFVIEEFAFVRNRLLPQNYNEYTSSEFKRTGRSIPLQESLRAVVLKAIRQYEESLDRMHWADHEKIVHEAIRFINNCGYKKYRSIMIDEVQDLAQNDLRAIGLMRNGANELIKESPNGLFLVGDGAQTIYKNGFSLKRLGVNVVGRSFTFAKNYRNTKEILEAAYALIKNFDCSSIDEEERIKPIAPEVAKQSGPKPKIVKSYSLRNECAYVSSAIKFLVDNGEVAGSICVIGMNKKIRIIIEETLKSLGINASEIKDNVSVGNDIVKISTIESAKGHEFSTVFIVGLSTQLGQTLSEEEQQLEASRLYVAMTRACNNLIMTYSVSGCFAASPLLMYFEDYCICEENR